MSLLVSYEINHEHQTFIDYPSVNIRNILKCHSVYSDTTCLIKVYILVSNVWTSAVSFVSQLDS